jgi:Cu/Ag efflux protein CusF
VPDKASITAGKVTKKLSDIKVGDKIRMKYVREEDKLVVQSIAIQ